MNRTPIKRLPEDTPKEILSLLEGARLYDSSCSPEARVFFADKDGGYYLKRSPRGTLKNEVLMTSYFHAKGLGTEVLSYIEKDSDWMLTARVNGEDCTNEMYLSDPKRLSVLLAEKLKQIHELDPSDCPIQNRTKDYLALAEKNYSTGNYDKDQFPDAFGYSSPDEAYKVLCEGKSALRGDVLIHGDYCLPNVMLDNWNFSAFIDLGNGGVGDRHIDLFWGTWTLWFNLKTDKYKDLFLDAYGRESVDSDILRTIAAAEVFG